METSRLASAATTELAEEILDNMRAIATGSYLREEERALWEPLFPESAVEDVARALEDFFRRADTHLGSAEAEAVIGLLRAEDPEARRQRDFAGELTTGLLEEGIITAEPSARTQALCVLCSDLLRELYALSEANEGALLEEEEIEDLGHALASFARDVGAEADYVQLYVPAYAEFLAA